SEPADDEQQRHGRAGGCPHADEDGADGVRVGAAAGPDAPPQPRQDAGGGAHRPHDEVLLGGAGQAAGGGADGLPCAGVPCGADGLAGRLGDAPAGGLGELADGGLAQGAAGGIQGGGAGLLQCGAGGAALACGVVAEPVLLLGEV